MATESMSFRIQDQSSTYVQQMPHLTDKFDNDSPVSSSCGAEFDHDPQSWFSRLVSVEDLRQPSTGTDDVSDLEKNFFPESIASCSDSAVSSDFAHVAHGRMQSTGSHPSSQLLPIADESVGRALSGEYGSLSFNELSDSWGDFRLFSQEMATPAMLSPQELVWKEGSAFRISNGDPMTTTIFVEQPSEQRSSSYQIPTKAETSAPQGTDFKCPRPLQPENGHSPPPGATSFTSVCSGSLIYHKSLWTKPEDTALALSSSHQPEILQKTLNTRPQLSTGRKSRFHSQSLAGDRVLDAVVLEHFSDTVHASKLTPGSREENFLQQTPSLSMSSSPDLTRRRAGGKAHQVTIENLNSQKKQKLKEQSLVRQAPRKYQRRRPVNDSDVSTPFGHVQRERQRRDLMTLKIAALEVLLPKSSKRDRISVVYDTIQLLKKLEREVEILQKKFQEVKLRRASTAPSARPRPSLDPGKTSIRKSIDCGMGVSENCFANGVVIKRSGTYMKPIAMLTQPTLGTSGTSMPRLRFSKISSSQRLGDHKTLEKGDVFVEFHVHLDDAVTVQEEKLLKRRCRMDYLRTMMSLVDDFQLDVINCNIVKLSGYFICVVGLKTRSRRLTTTAAQFALRLQSAVDVNAAREAVIISPFDAKPSEGVTN